MTSTTLERPDKFQIGRVFNNTFAVISRNIGLCVGLWRAVFRPAAILIRLWTLAADRRGSARQSRRRGRSHRDVFRHSWITIVAGFISFFLALLLQSALVRATIEDLNGQAADLWRLHQIAVRYLLPTLGIGCSSALVPASPCWRWWCGHHLWLGWSVSVPV